MEKEIYVGRMIALEKIASFQVNHDLLEKGMYISRIDGDVVTYDIRMFKPNAGTYMTTGAGHSFEHIFATAARNSELGGKVLYVGPMGCRTGFYLLMRGASHEEAIKLVQDCMKEIAEFEGELPGASRIECGNYLDHDVPGAKLMGADMAEVLRGWSPDMMIYRV